MPSGGDGETEEPNGLYNFDADGEHHRTGLSGL